MTSGQDTGPQPAPAAARPDLDNQAAARGPAPRRVSPAHWMGNGRSVTHSRRGLHGRVVDELGARIVEGTLPPGTIIQLESLVNEMQVSRTVLREAFKVLTAKGLLDARPHTGTYVLGRDRWNLLDADVICWRNTPAPDAQLLRELEEVRQIVEPWGSRLAAERRTDEQLIAIQEAYAALAATESQTSAATADADIHFHRALVAASHNELLGRLAGLLEPLLRVRDVMARHADDAGPTFVDYHRAVVDRVTAGDGPGAFDATTALLRGAAADTEVSLSGATIPAPAKPGRRSPQRPRPGEAAEPPSP